MNLPYAHFHYCPRCGRRAASPPSEPVFRCTACDFLLFFNPAVAAAAFLRNTGGEILFLRRAKDPAKGKLAPPGGFIDYSETAEQGLHREISEEIGLQAGPLTYLCSQVNTYAYHETTYPVVDLFFTGLLPGNAAPRCLDGVEALEWLQPTQIDPDALAFPSVRAAFDRLMTLDISA